MIARLYLSNSAEIVLNMMASLPGNRNPMADERSQSEIQFAILPSVTPPTDSRKMEGTLARRSDSNEANLMTHPRRSSCSIWNQRKDAQQIAAADRHQPHKLEPTAFPFAPAAGLDVLHKMKKSIAVVALTFGTLIVALLIFGSLPVSSQPEKSEIVGEWECTDLPEGFVRQVDNKIGNPIGRISIRDDGGLSASNFPQRSPYRLVDVDGVWELADPSMTPTGAWSVEFQGEHLQCRRGVRQLILRYTISGKDNYYAVYKKK